MGWGVIVLNFLVVGLSKKNTDPDFKTHIFWICLTIYDILVQTEFSVLF